MRLVTYNIQFSRGMDGRCDLDRIAEAVRGADLIALQEVERNWPREGHDGVDQPQRLATLLGDYHWVYGPAFDMHGGGTGAASRRRQHGLMLLSRAPIVTSRLTVLPKVHYTDRYNMLQGALRATFESPLGVLEVCNCHLGYLEAAERMLQLDALFGEHERLAREGGAWSGPGHIRGDDWSAGQPAPAMPAARVWLGDFNARPESAEYARIVANGYVDTWTAAGNAAPHPVSHYRAGTATPDPGRRLDYIFVARGLGARVRRAWVDDDAQGSDHRPVWAELD